MTLPRLRILLCVPVAVLAVLAAGCPKDEETTPEPLPPAYPPADVANLISHEGGTGGGPNMGKVTVVLFDDDDETVPPARLSGAEVLLWHGSGTLVRKTSDANGQAEFPGITAGAVTFAAVKDGYVNLTVVDLNAATAALGLKRKGILVSGTVTRQLPGSRVEIELATKEWNAFDGKAEEKYGYVSSSQPGAVGNSWTYELWLRGGVTEDMVVREVDSATGEVLNREVRAIAQNAAPPWTNPTQNFTFDATSPTGLHAVTFSLSGVHSGAAKVVSWFEENYVRYSSWSCSAVTPGNWTTVLQMPESRVNAKIVHSTYLDAASDTPVESWEQNYTSGTEAVPGAQTVAEAFADIHGELLNPVSTEDLFIIEARYNGRSHLTFGARNWTGDDYSIRAPISATVDLRALEQQGVGAGTLGTMMAHRVYTLTVGGADAPHDFDFTGYAAKPVTLTAPEPLGIPNANPFAALTGPYPSSTKFLPLPFMAAGSTAGGTITFPLRYGDIAGVVFLLIVIVQEEGAAGGAAASFHVQGNLANPQGTLGTNPTLALLDAPRILGPADGGTVPRDGIVCAWTADAAMSTGGFFSVDIKNEDSQTAWTVLVRNSTRQFTLPELPTDLAAFNLVKDDTYRCQVASILKTALDFDNLLRDSIPEKIEEMATMAEAMRTSSSREVEFRVAP